MPDSKGNNYFVILTGSKSNAGDFLIKHRAKVLFKDMRPDRTVVDMNAWDDISEEKLGIINNSKALILMGGPALQKNMNGGIYNLPKNLEKIKVPITTLGIGWKSMLGSWEESYDYFLSSQTIELLKRIKKDDLLCSVRDFQTQNVLFFKRINKCLMTGCPAYYDLDSINTGFQYPAEIKKVAFSLGVSFIQSPSMKELMKSQILAFKEKYKDSDFEVVFHHSLNKDVFIGTHGATNEHVKGHIDFAKWLSDQDISYIDISGSAENLIGYYRTVDLHIGYRVHAHIFMNSVKRLSLLFSEDGRAKGSQSAIGGMVVDAYTGFRSNLISKVLNKVFKSYDRYKANKLSTKDAFCILLNEETTKGQKSRLSRNAIDNNFVLMEKFMRALP